MADADADGAERAAATAEEASGVTPDVVERLASEPPLRECVFPSMQCPCTVWPFVQICYGDRFDRAYH